MRRIICLGLALALTACEGQTFLSKRADVQDCLMKEAQNRIVDGSAFAAPIRTTAQNMVNACLTAEEQTPVMQQLAQRILTNLMQEAEKQ